MFPVLKHIAIVMPVYNDWDAAQRLLPLIDHALRSTSCRADILLIDDASTEQPENDWPEEFARIDNVSILHLRRNLGHQRAIAVGLVHVFQNSPHIDALVVMDADGEDRPQDIPALLDAFEREKGRKVIFAARARRMESFTFKFYYHAYRIIHKALTGISVRVGNFSVIPPEALGRLMVVSELWNHYAAAVFRSRIPYTSTPLSRGTRLAGRSHMNFVSLLVHGLGAISVFSDIVGARLLALTAVATGVAVLLMGAMAGAHLITGANMPSWAPYVAGILVIILAQALVAAVALVFIIVSGRTATGFVPIRDGSFFVDRVEQVSPVHA